MQVKKAYRKLALKYHPDKAMANCKFATSFTPACPRLIGSSQVSSRLLFNPLRYCWEYRTSSHLQWWPTSKRECGTMSINCRDCGAVLVGFTNWPCGAKFWLLMEEPEHEISSILLPFIAESPVHQIASELRLPTYLSARAVSMLWHYSHSLLVALFPTTDSENPILYFVDRRVGEEPGEQALPDDRCCSWNPLRSRGSQKAWSRLAAGRKSPQQSKVAFHVRLEIWFPLLQLQVIASEGVQSHAW